MVLAEALRSTWPFGGLPIGGVALGQASSPLAGAARLGGPLLLVGLVWVGGGGLAHPGDDGQRGASPGPGRVGDGAGRGALGPALAGAAALAVVVGLSGWGAAAPDGGAAIHTLRIASVQGGGVRGLRKAEVDPATVTAAQFAATKEIASHDGGRAPSLVLWPEDVVSLDTPIDGTQTEKQLEALAVSLHATLVVGVTETVSSQSFRNEIVAFSPTGRLVARFEKVHRVPFGEYVPYRGFFKHLASLSSVPLDAIPGHGNGVLHTPAGPLGTLVSYEVFYAQRGWVTTRAGAQLLDRPHQHLVLPHEPGPDPGDRRGQAPGHLRRARRGPGRARRDSAPWSTTAAGSWLAPTWRCGPSSSGTSSCAVAAPSTNGSVTAPCSSVSGLLVVAGWLAALMTPGEPDPTGSRTAPAPSPPARLIRRVDALSPTAARRGGRPPSGACRPSSRRWSTRRSRACGSGRAARCRWCARSARSAPPAR